MALAVGAAVLGTAMMMAQMPPDTQLYQGESDELLQTLALPIPYTVERSENTMFARNASAPRNPPNMRAKSVREVQESFAKNNATL